MRIFDLAHDRRGTAGIEFGLILPIFVLMILGLKETAQHNLMQIDIDTAANTGASFAIREGFAPKRIAAAIRAVNGTDITTTIRLIECGKSPRPDGGKVDCRALPAGRYVKIVTRARRKSLFGTLRPDSIAALAVVRIH